MKENALKVLADNIWKNAGKNLRNGFIFVGNGNVIYFDLMRTEFYKVTEEGKLIGTYNGIIPSEVYYLPESEFLRHFPIGIHPFLSKGEGERKPKAGDKILTLSKHGNYFEHKIEAVNGDGKAFKSNGIWKAFSEYASFEYLN